MEYAQGKMGRVFYARFDHGEDLLAGLRELAEKESVRCGWFQIFGGLMEADVVTGPEEPVMPPKPVWEQVRDSREVLGVGSIFFDGSKPLLHVHGALGHHGETLTGCIREHSEIYLLIEAVIYEITGIDVTRPWYEQGGFNRPEFNKTTRPDKVLDGFGHTPFYK